MGVGMAGWKESLGEKKRKGHKKYVEHLLHFQLYLKREDH